MEGLNGSMRVDLNQSEIHFYDNATIEFHNKDNAIVRRKGTHTAFVHFNDTPPDEDQGIGSLFAAIGVTSSGDGVNSASSGRFSGLRVYRAARGLEHHAVIDQAELYGDRILLKDDFYLDRGFSFHPASLPKGRWINVTNLGFAAAALARVWQHFLTGEIQHLLTFKKTSKPLSAKLPTGKRRIYERTNLHFNDSRHRKSER